MPDIRQSRSSSDSDTTIFEAESVAGDLWMRQNYQDIHLQLDAEEAKSFVQKAEGAGLILAENQPSPDLAH